MASVSLAGRRLGAGFRAVTRVLILTLAFTSVPLPPLIPVAHAQTAPPVATPSALGNIPSASPPYTLGGYVQVSSVRVTRTLYDYTYTAQLTHAGTTAAPELLARLTTSTPATQIVDGEVSFANVPAGRTIAGLDTFTLRQDRTVAFDPSKLLWTVSVNQPPIANAGPDGSAPPGATVKLDGSASSDANGSPLTFAWTVQSVPSGGGITLKDPTSVTPSFVPTVAGTYVLRLMVNDGRFDSAPDTVTITVAGANAPPVAQDDSYAMDAGKPLSVSRPGVLGNDSDPDGNQLAATLAKPPSRGSVTLNPDGSFAYVPTPPTSVTNLSPKLKWSWTGSATLPQSTNVLATPLVVDLDLDGVPDVVFGTTSDPGGTEILPGVLRAVSGDDGHELFTVADPAHWINADAQLAIADLDGDGHPEIVASDASGRRLIAFAHDGTFKWRSDALELINWGGPAIADLDGDGTPEIVVGRQVLYANGTLRWTGAGGSGNRVVGAIAQGALSVVADLDLDGIPEVIAGNTAYRPDGSIKWQAPIPDGFVAVGNFDDDPFAEIVVVGSGQVWLLDHQGNVQWGPVAVPGGGFGGSPALADVDGDGWPEIGVAGTHRFAVLTRLGTLKWQAVTQDRSPTMSASAFDFDSDGAAEIVARDEVTLRVYRGSDGAVLFETPLSSCTWYEYPVVADVDGDGHAEVVVGANTYCGYGSQRGLFVYGDAGSGWAPTRGVWNQHGYHVTNVSEEGTVPRREAVNWLIPGLNNFRLNAFGPGDTALADSFTYRAGDGRASSNEATVYLNLRPANLPPVFTSIAPLAATAGVTYSYQASAIDPDASSTLSFLLAAAPSEMTIDAATGLVRWIPTAAQGGPQTVTLRVRDAGGLFTEQSFVIVVTVPPVNRAPVFTSTPVTAATATKPYTYDVAATDADGDAISYSLVVAPSGMTIDAGTGLIAWTPTPAQAGANSVTIKAQDPGGLYSTQGFAVSVIEPVNRPPNAIDDAFTVDEGASLSVGGGASGADPVPSVSGHRVEVYARLEAPVQLAFAADGTLFAGYDVVGNSTPNDPGYVRRIGRGGSPIANYGGLQVDPDAVLVDTQGVVSNAPGAVLVSGTNSNGAETHLSAILPDGSTVKIFGSSQFRANTNALAFDRRGRLLFAASPDSSLPSDANRVLVSAGGAPATLINLGPRIPNDIAVDAANRIFVGTADGTIGIYGEDGTPVASTFVTGLGNVRGLAFGNGGAFGADLHAIDGAGRLLRIDGSGRITVLGSGFDDALDLAFGPDFALYVSEYTRGRILRLTVLQVGGLSGGVLDNDSDPDGDPLTAVLIARPISGNLAFGTGGGFTYTPIAGFRGADVFTYKASDAKAESNVATVTITVQPVNHAPVFTSVPVLAATAGLAYVYDANAVDPDSGDALAFSLPTAPAGMTIEPASGLIGWTPQRTQAGIHSITVRVQDPGGLEAVQVFAVTVTPPPNRAPVALDDQFEVDAQGTSTIPAPGVLGNDTDPDGDPLTARLTLPPQRGSAVLNPDGSIRYTPGASGRVVINFDDIDTAGTNTAQVSSRYGCSGVIFSANGQPATLYRDGYGGSGALSLPNSLGSTFPSLEIATATFVESATGSPATTDFVSAMVGDKSGESDLITMTAYGLNGTVIGSQTYLSRFSGDFGPVAISAPGVHRVVFTVDNTSGANVDDFTFAPIGATDCLGYQASDGRLDSNVASVTLTSRQANHAPTISAAGIEPRWNKLEPSGTAPTARSHLGSAYDAVNDRMIVFGGFAQAGPAATDQVWVLVNATGRGGTPEWKQLNPTGSLPPARNRPQVAYDPTANRLVIHGGCVAGNCTVPLSDTWVLTNANGLGGTPEWIPLPVGTVHMTAGHAYDAISNRLMLFGGLKDAQLFNDGNGVRVLVDANGIGEPRWIDLVPAGVLPPPRSELYALGYDGVNNRLLVFGGYRWQDIDYNDVWVLKNANGLGGTPEWEQLLPSGAGPDPRTSMPVNYDPNSNRLIVFGGIRNGVTPDVFFDDVWVLSHANGIGGTPAWTRLRTEAPGPVARRSHAAVYDPASNRLVAGLGINDNLSTTFNDVWVLDSASGQCTAVRLCRLRIAASDPDAGDTLTYTLDAAPAGMTIDPATGAMTWTPAIAQIGNHAVTVRVTDRGGLFARQTFTATVASVAVPNVVGLAPEWAESFITAADLTVGTKTSIGGAITLSFDSLPSRQGWTYWVSGPGVPVEDRLFKVDGGVLFQDTLGIGGRAAGYELLTGVDSRLPLSIMVRARVLAEEGSTGGNHAGFGFTAWTGSTLAGNNIFLGGLGTDWLEIDTSLGAALAPLDPSFDRTAFHSYLLRGHPGRESDLSVDGVRILTGAARVYPAIPFYDLYLGDVTEGPNARADVTAYSFTQPRVVGQNPPPGTLVPNKTAVDLTIVDGPATQTVPNLTGLTQSQADAALVAANLVIGAISSAPSATIPAGQVSDQSPLPGIHVPKSTPVNIVLSTGPPAGNLAPTISSSPVLAATAGQLYAYPVTATDPNPGDTLTFSLPTAPAGMTINPRSGAISWTPTDAEVGNQPVTVRVTDAGGLFAEQNFTVVVAPRPNHAPVFTSTPVTTATATKPYTYDADATDADGDVITYSLVVAPSGMTIDATSGVIAWTPTVAQVGSQNVNVKALDARGAAGTQTFAIVVAAAPPPTTIVPNVVGLSPDDATAAIVAALLTLGSVGTAYDATVPAGRVASQAPAAGTVVTQGSAVNLVLSLGPAPVTVPSVVSLNQSAAEAAIVAAGLTVGPITPAYSATVPAGSVISQSPGGGSAVPRGSAVALIVSQGPELVSVPDVVGTAQADARAALTASGLAIGPETQEASSSVPAGAVIRQTPAAGTLVPKGASVALVLSSGPPAPGLASILVLPATPTIITTSSSQQFTAYAILSNGSSQVVTGNATWGSSDPAVAFVSATPGLIGSTAAGTGAATISASYGGKTGSATITVVLRQPNGSPPTAEITSPADQAEIIGPVSVVGTATDPEFLRYVVEIAPVGEANYTPIAESTTPVVNGTLGTLDPTLLVNDLYNLRLRVFDRGGIVVTTAPIQVQIKRERKVGIFTLAFQDGNIPYSCLPVSVTRVYDSRDKRVGDFGVGWRLDLQTMRLRETGTMGSGWAIDLVNEPGPFGVPIPTYKLYDIAAHKVALTLPDGHVEEFDLTPSPSESKINAIGPLALNYTPRPGTLGSLAPVVTATYAPSGDTGEVLLIDSEASLLNPQQYRYTSKDGTVFVIDKTIGVQQVQCTNGPALTVTLSGINHDAGPGALFTRDGQGRITSLTDPNGRTQSYTYDGNGDLASHTDAAGNVTRYVYNRTHGLLEIQDPRGIAAIRNDYDADGRLVASTDPLGKTSTFNHDLVARTETITDRLGNLTVHEYDDAGNVLRTVDAAGGVTLRAYDAFGNETSRTDPLGRTTTIEYDSRRNVLKETDPLGRATSYTYNALSQVTKVTDALGRETTNTYDVNGNLTQAHDALGNTTSYVYDVGGVILRGSGNLLSRTDALGNTTAYEYDSAGRMTKETDALGRVTTNSYDANGNRTTQITTRTVGGAPQTLTTTFAYDANNRLIRTTHPDGSVTQTEYNAIGKQAKTIDALGRETRYDYDALGRLAKTTYPDGGSDASAYDAEGRRTASTDRAGRTTSYTYDALGRLTRTAYVDGAATGTTYDAAGQVTASIDARGNVTTYNYDAAGRRTHVTDAAGAVTRFVYDAAGNQTQVTDANGNAVSFTYDAANRRTRTTYPDSSFDSVAYDALGRQVTKTDQAGRVMQYGYDALGRLIQVTDALGQVTRYGYDEQGNQLTQTDALGRVTRFAYDAMGRRVSRTLPLGMIETMSYDPAGNLASKTDFNGRTTTYVYDNLNRLVSKTPAAVFGQPPVQFSYLVTGQRASMQDASGTTTYTYDNRDRLVTKATPQGTLSYTYDANGSVASIASNHTNGAQMSYAYDARNRLVSVSDRHGTTTYTYDAVGNLAGFLYPNGVEHRYTYNTLNRLTNVTGAKGATKLASYTYTLGPAGNRMSVTEASGRRADYSYDALYRLVGETITSDPGGKNGAIGYVYDAVGNRLNRTSTHPDITAQTFAYDDNDRITTETYDANGNTLASGTQTFAWDFENKLVSANLGAVQFVYDGDGNRVGETTGGVTTTFLVDTLNPTGYSQVLEEVSGGAMQRTYTWGLKLINQTQASGVSYYGFDGHGSVRYLTNSGADAIAVYGYDAFGILVASSGSTQNAHLYAGEFADPEQPIYLRSRWYSSEIGRFATRDRHSGDIRVPITTHSYVYAIDEPINNVDPSGQFFLTLDLGLSSTLRPIVTRPYGEQTAVLRRACQNSRILSQFCPLGGTRTRDFEIAADFDTSVYYSSGRYGIGIEYMLVKIRPKQVIARALTLPGLAGRSTSFQPTAQFLFLGVSVALALPSKIPLSSTTTAAAGGWSDLSTDEPMALRDFAGGGFIATYNLGTLIAGGTGSEVFFGNDIFHPKSRWNQLRPSWAYGFATPGVSLSGGTWVQVGEY